MRKRKRRIRLRKSRLRDRIEIDRCDGDDM